MDSIRTFRINKHKIVSNLIRVQGTMNGGSNGSYPVRQVTYGISHVSYQERHKGSGDIPLDMDLSSRSCPLGYHRWVGKRNPSRSFALASWPADTTYHI